MGAGVLAYPLLDHQTRTLLLEEAPSFVAVVAVILLVLCTNGLFLMLFPYTEAASGWRSRYCLRTANIVGACLCVVAGYAAFTIGAVWTAAVAAVLLIIFVANAVLL
ncbi:MAG: hypothetical protein ACE5HB_03215 [Terriglobia bacterium]